MYNSISRTDVKNKLPNSLQGSKNKHDTIINIVNYDLDNNNYFQHDIISYIPTDGLPMGGSTSNKILLDYKINLIMKELIKRVLKLIWIYADDILNTYIERNTNLRYTLTNLYNTTHFSIST